MKKLILLTSIILIILPINIYAFTITLSWTKSPSTDVAYYKVYQSTTSKVYPVTPIATALPINNMMTLTKIPETVPTYWIITAVDTNGNESAPTAELTTKWYILFKKIFGSLIPPYMTYWYDDGNPTDYNICL